VVKVEAEVEVVAIMVVIMVVVTLPYLQNVAIQSRQAVDPPAVPPVDTKVLQEVVPQALQVVATQVSLSGRMPQAPR
jgi:hypothetical protein